MTTALNQSPGFEGIGVTLPVLAPGDNSPVGRQAALVAFGRRAVAPPEAAVLIMDAAALVAETLGADHYGAAELSADGQSLSLRIAPTGRSVEEPAQRQFDIPLDKRSSLAAFTLNVARATAVKDLKIETRFHDQVLASQGLCSALMAPLQVSDEAYGAIGVFHRDRREFAIEDMLFAEAIAHLVSSTIGRERAVKQLTEERKLTGALFETGDALILVLDADSRVVKVNRALERLSGFSLAELAGRPLWNKLIVHDDVAPTQRIIEQLLANREAVELESTVLTKHGERRRIRWSHTVTLTETGGIASIVATGVDLTRQLEMEEQVRSLEATLKAADVVPPSGETLAPPSERPLSQASTPFRPLEAGPFVERRQHPRRAFQYMQPVGAMVANRLPPRESFRQFQCHDISSGGISFLFDEPPKYSHYVVGLGMAPAQIYVVARVVHTRATQYNGRAMYVVGCQYERRAEYGKR